jgi:5-methylcytosine-specific restriction endonuclease McrA
MPGRRFAFAQGHSQPRGALQAKLVVGAPGDRYEREADRIARAVTRGGSGPGVRGVQRFGGTGAGTAPPDAAVRSRILAASAGGRGQRIPGQVRAPLEHALGADFSGVRVHADAGADRLSRSLRASALTTGQDIFFRQGTYAPGSREGNALLTHELVHVMQQRGGQPGTAEAVQLNRPEKYKTYARAKDANIYSEALLDEQRGDLLGNHIGKAFDKAQRTKIYKVNRAQTKSKEITSDWKPHVTLYRQDTSRTPHVDHRYPKSKNGSNSYANAAVIPARQNIAKSDKLDLDKEPSVPLKPYKGLKDPPGVMYGKEFSKEQKDEIYRANRKFYKKHSIISDADGETPLERIDSAEVPHIDHITPRSSGGTNYYFNARVISAEENIEKGGQRGGMFGENKYTWEERQMTLREFIRYRQGHPMPDRILNPPTSPPHGDESSSEQRTEEDENLPNAYKRSRSSSTPSSVSKKRKTTDTRKSRR